MTLGFTGGIRRKPVARHVAVCALLLLGVSSYFALDRLTLLAATWRFSELPPSAPTLPIGIHMLPLTLLDQAGSPVDLTTPAGPLLLVVFRGVWCPYCRKELARLAEQVPRFSSGALRVYGISGDPPEALL